MSESHQEPNYMAIFAWLTILTALEVGVVFVPLSKLVIAVTLVLMALAKAILVALYFMHLKFEKRTLGIIALTPLILCTLLIIALLPDLTATPHETKESKAAQLQNNEEHQPIAELTKIEN